MNALGERATRLRIHRDELLGQLEAADLQAPSDTDLADVRHDLETAIRDGSPAQVKALVHALVHEVRVEAPDAVRPVFKIPTGTDVTTLSEAVRAPSRLVEVSGLEPPTSTLRKWIATTL